jgi:hypothetical protein
MIFQCLDDTSCAGSSGPVHNVILIECIFRSGNLGGVGILGEGE